MKTLKLILSIALVFLFYFSQAQREERKLIDNGNTEYKNEKYNEAEILYRKSLEKNRESEIANFNLGDALYKQGKYEDAANIFNGIAGKTTDKDLKAKAFHNLGNSLLKTEKYQESVNAYKNSLKNNSVDEETRYNLAYAMSKLQQQQQQNQQNQDKKDEKQEKQEQQKQDEKKDEKKQDEQQQADNNDQQEKEQQQQKQDKLSKQDAERMLEALGKEEKDVQDKMKKERLKQAQKMKIEKDW